MDEIFNIKWERREQKRKTQNQKWVIHKTLWVVRNRIGKKKMDLLYWKADKYWKRTKPKSNKDKQE